MEGKKKKKAFEIWEMENDIETWIIAYVAERGEM